MTQVQELQSKQARELFEFLNEYDEFLHRMIADEEEKLRALLSSSLQRIEHALSIAQANAKQLQNMEARREMLQQKAGFAGMSFSEILAVIPEEQSEEGRELFERFDRDVKEIKYRNEKSMDFARGNIREINPDALREDAPAPKGAAGTAYAKMSRADERPSMLETKI